MFAIGTLRRRRLLDAMDDAVDDVVCALEDFYYILCGFIDFLASLSLTCLVILIFLLTSLMCLKRKLFATPQRVSRRPQRSIDLDEEDGEDGATEATLSMPDTDFVPYHFAPNEMILTPKTKNSCSFSRSCPNFTCMHAICGSTTRICENVCNTPLKASRSCDKPL